MSNKVDCYLILSNGRTTRSFSNTEEGGPKTQAPKTLTRDAIALMVRLGLGPIAFSVLRPTGNEVQTPFSAIRDTFLYSNLGEGNDGTSKTLSYTMKTRDGSLNVAVKLWYDPASAKLIRRTLTQRNNAQAVETAVEVYTEFVLNAEIPADEFKIAGED